MSDESEAKSTTAERWMPISGWPYDVSSFGQIARRLEDGTRRTLRPHVHKVSGHLIVCLRVGGEGKTSAVRALVAAAFLPPRQPGEWLCFRDGDKTNCRADNLAFRDSSEAIQEAYRNGTRRPLTTSTVLTSEIYQQIRLLWSTRRFSQMDLARMYRIHHSTVSKIVRGLQSPRSGNCVPTFIDPEIFTTALRIARTEQPYRPGAKKGPLGQGLARAMEIIAKFPEINGPELGEAMGVGRRTAWKYIKRVKKLKQQGATNEQGNDSGTPAALVSPSDGPARGEGPDTGNRSGRAVLPPVA